MLSTELVCWVQNLIVGKKSKSSEKGSLGRLTILTIPGSLNNTRPVSHVLHELCSCIYVGRDTTEIWLQWRLTIPLQDLLQKAPRNGRSRSLSRLYSEEEGRQYTRLCLTKCSPIFELIHSSTVHSRRKPSLYWCCIASFLLQGFNDPVGD